MNRTHIDCLLVEQSAIEFTKKTFSKTQLRQLRFMRQNQHKAGKDCYIEDVRCIYPVAKVAVWRIRIRLFFLKSRSELKGEVASATQTNY